MSNKKTFVFLMTLLLLMPLVLSFFSMQLYIPDSLYVIKGSSPKINTAGLISCDISEYNTHMEAATTHDGFAEQENNEIKLYAETVGRYDADITFMGILPVKTVSVKVVEQGEVIASGKAVGIKIHTRGVLLVKLATVEDDYGNVCSPARDAGLKVGDVIHELDGKPVSDSDTFSEIIASSGGGSVLVGVIRNGEKMSFSVKPAASAEGYKIGAWIRDSSAGIGTMTFVDPAKEVFAALGHGISDRDTETVLSVGYGSVCECEIVGAQKGEKGAPGMLKGVLSGEDEGIIEKNSNVGVYGKIDNVPKGNLMEVASRFEIQTGMATILSTIDGEGTKEYEIVIEKVMTNSGDEKGMIIRVIDEELLEKTGGIVQGMSGSPIIQNGKLIGAVTHVFVNDPTRGYGIFIENMLAEAEKIK